MAMCGTPSCPRSGEPNLKVTYEVASPQSVFIFVYAYSNRAEGHLQGYPSLLHAISIQERQYTTFYTKLSLVFLFPKLSLVFLFPKLSLVFLFSMLAFVFRDWILLKLIGTSSSLSKDFCPLEVPLLLLTVSGLADKS